MANESIEHFDKDRIYAKEWNRTIDFFAKEIKKNLNDYESISIETINPTESIRFNFFGIKKNQRYVYEIDIKARALTIFSNDLNLRIALELIDKFRTEFKEEKIVTEIKQIQEEPAPTIDPKDTLELT